MKCFRSVYRSKIALLFFSPALEINDFSNQRIFFFLLVPFLHRGFKKKALRAQTVHWNLPLSWIMYQDYSGNYDTSSRGSSTSPAQPESFTSGSSTIGSPISTSSYQVTEGKDWLQINLLMNAFWITWKCQFVLVQSPIFRKLFHRVATSSH